MLCYAKDLVTDKHQLLTFKSKNDSQSIPSM